MTYPDEVVFCFNPNIITIQTTNEIEIEISEGDRTYLQTFSTIFDKTFRYKIKPTYRYYTDKRYPFSNKVEIDISMYLQVFFDIDRKSLIGSKVITVIITNGSNTFRFTMTVIWGAMNIGEVFENPKWVRRYTNLPFTFSYFEDEMKHTSAVPTYGIAITDDSCTEGVYLRWIDRHGFYRYWLFQEGITDSKSEEYGERLVDNFYGSQYGYYGVGWVQGKNIENSKKVCAPLVSREVFYMLLSIHSSPLVDMYVDGMWTPVNVSSGTINDSGDDLQDFEITIVLPDIISQSL